MKVNGVTFVDAEVKKMTKAKFIAMCIDNFYLDKPRADRKKILSDVYDLITKK